MAKYGPNSQIWPNINMCKWGTPEKNCENVAQQMLIKWLWQIPNMFDCQLVKF